MFKELSLAECLKLEDLITPFESFQEFASATTTFDHISNNTIDLTQDDSSESATNNPTSAASSFNQNA